MTLISIKSDLHADFTGNRIDLPDVECDVHLVLGDGAAPLTHALPILRDAIKDDKPIAYAPGNHDYYYTERHPQTFLQDELARGIELGKSLGIDVLSNDVMIVGDCRILCTTLWTNFGARPDHLSRKMAMSISQKGWYGDEPRYGGARNFHNDFKEIRFNGPGNRNRFSPSQWLQLHDEAMSWLRAELAQEWSGTTVCATHMAPSIQSLMPSAAGSPAGSIAREWLDHDWLYATTDCDDLFSSVDLWAHGHIHASRDYEIDGCRVLSNPRGYPQPEGGFENRHWDPAMVVEVRPKFDRRMTP